MRIEPANKRTPGNGAVAFLFHAELLRRAVPEQFLHLCQYRPGAWFKPLDGHPGGTCPALSACLVTIPRQRQG